MDAWAETDYHCCMSEQTYQGSCHCGNVRFEVPLDLSKPAVGCNCSMCARSGSLLQFVGASQFKLLNGEESLSDYQFNKNVIHHFFCKNCGIKPFARGKNADGSDMVAVNTRCLEGVDPATLSVYQHDGKNS